MSIAPNPLQALLLDGKGGARALNVDEIDHWQPKQGVLWLHFDYTDDANRLWFEQNSGLNDLVSDALLTDNTRPRTASVDDGLLIALRGVNLNPHSDPEDMVSVRLYVTEHRIISTRRRRLMSVTALAEDLTAGKGPRTVADFIVELSSRLVERIDDFVDDIEEALSARELELLDGRNGAEQRQALASIRRQAITLRRHFGPQREAFNQLQSERIGWFTVEHRLQLREVNDRLLRHIEDLDIIRERASMAQEELISQMSEQLNQRMYLLSLIAAIFLPLGFLTGLLGINVGGIPGSENPHAFTLFLMLLALLIGLQLWLFRRWRWF